MLSVPRINALKWTFPRDASTLGYPVALPLLTHPTHNMLFLFFFKSEWDKFILNSVMVFI